MTAQLIDRIYECSFLPELWPGVLAELGQIAGARGGCLSIFNADIGILRWTASPNIQEGVARSFELGIATRGQVLPRLLAARHAGFLRNNDVFTDEELAADEVYRDYYRPIGLGWSTGTVFPLPTGDMLIFNMEREYVRGPVELDAVRRLDALRRHLARSALMSARLQLERARAISEALGLIGMPALVFDQWGKVLAANPLIETLTEHVRWRARDRVSLKDLSADALFQQAIATLDVEDVAPARSFAVRGADANAALVAHVIPIRRTARDIFTRCAGVLMMTPLTLPHAPPVELVQSLFDLTAAEARVARGLAAGDTVDEIASIGAVSANTVRTQVRGVLEKTGCRRQAEVVALLSGLAIAS